MGSKKKKNKNSLNTTSQDQALPMYHPAQRRANKHETQRKPHCLHQSRSSSQLRMYVCTVPVPNFHEQPTAEADRTINLSEFAATCDSSLRPVMVRCDSVLSRIAIYPKENRLA